MVLFDRLKEKALLKIGQVASNPTLNKVADYAQAGRQRVAESDPRSYWMPAAMQNIKTGIKPVDYLANRFGNYIENTYVKGAKDIPDAFRQTFTPTDGKITSKNLWGAGRLGLDALLAVPDPTDLLIAPYEYLKGVNKAKLEGKEGWDVTGEGVKAATYEKPVGLGESVTTEPGLTQSLFNVAELPLLLAGGVLRNKQAGKTLEKIDVPKADDFLKRTKDLFSKEVVDESVQGIRPGVENLTTKLKRSSFDSARLLDDLHEWFSRGSKSFDTEKFTPAMVRYVDTLGDKKVKEIFDKYANATKVAPDSKTKMWKELRDAVEGRRGRLGDIVNKEQGLEEPVGRLEQLVDWGDNSSNARSKEMSKEELESLVGMGDEVVGVTNKQSSLKSGDESVEAVVKKTEDLINKPRLEPTIESFATSHPPKDTVSGESAVRAYKNMQAHGEALILTDDEFFKYLDNPESAPSNIKPLIEKHKELMDVSHPLRENPSLGKIENYVPRMKSSALNEIPELRRLGQDSWVSSFTADLGSSKKRTGALTDYSTDYSKVMKNYMDQVAFDKYGRQAGYDPKTAEFVKKVEKHLVPDKDGLYSKPGDDFSYVKASSEKVGNIEKPTMNIEARRSDTFDEVTNKITAEHGDNSLTFAMREVRDMGNRSEGTLKRIKDLPINEQIEILVERLTHVGQKMDLRDNLNKLAMADGNKKQLSDPTLLGLLRAEENYRVEALVNEIGKYKFNKKTTKYLDIEIDKLVKKTRYKQTLLDRAVNFATGTFYRAQIWGNLSTGLKQKGESTRVPVRYNSVDIKSGIKQKRIDKKNGIDILDKYDAGSVEVNVSKQLGIPQKESVLSKVDETAGKVGNFFVETGENSKNRDFLYAAEAEGKRVGLEGEELYTFVRSELFANGFILHQFNTPQMLDNPLIRLALQYQQYNVKLINRSLAMVDAGQKGDAAKMIGSQVFAAALIAGVTGKSVEGAIEQLMPGVGPGISFPIQIGELLKENYENENVDNSGRINKALTRNLVPFGNQTLKTTGALDILGQGYSESAKGNINYPVGDLNPLQEAQAIFFGSSSIPNAKEASKMWDARDKGTSDVYPTLTGKQSAVFKETPEDEQEAYYDKQIAKQSITAKKLANPEKRGLSDWFKKEETSNESKIKDLHFAKGDATSSDAGVRASAFSTLKTVFEDPELPDEYKQKVFEASGVTENEFEYYKMASMNTLDKRKGLIEFVSGEFEDRDELVTGTDYNYLYDMGYITKDEKNLLYNIRFDESTGKFYMDRDYKSGGGISATQQRSMINKANEIIKSRVSRKTRKPTKLSEIFKTPEHISALDLQPKRGTKSDTKWFKSY